MTSWSGFSPYTENTLMILCALKIGDRLSTLKAPNRPVSHLALPFLVTIDGHRWYHITITYLRIGQLMNPTFMRCELFNLPTSSGSITATASFIPRQLDPRTATFLLSGFPKAFSSTSNTPLSWIRKFRFGCLLLLFDPLFAPYLHSRLSK